MWSRIEPWLFRPWCIALLLGIAAALYVLPLEMLDPTSVAWINRDDTISHWLGWEQFRHSPLLQLPLGRSELYGLERSATVVFSDSIPLLALLLRPIEALLPTPFQYLGLWSLLCLILQAYFGYLLASLIFRPPAAAAATILFLMSAPMLIRIHVHTSLLSHWIVVAAIYSYFRFDDWRWRRWAVLISVASLVHGYLFGMTTVVWLAHLGKIAAMGKLRGGRRVVLAALGRAALVVLAVSAVMYLAGYFGYKGANYHLYGQARYDLLNPFCAYGVWSVATKGLTCGARGADYDGQAFLGLGGIAVLGLGLVGLVVTLLLRRRLDWRSRMPRWPLLVGCLLLLCFAATNEVVIGGKEAFQYPLPKRWLVAAETFRSSGRMAWPVFYAEVFLILALFARVVPARLHFWILAPLVLYQGYDYRYGIQVMNSHIPSAARMEERSSPVWDQLAHYDRLSSVPSTHGQADWHNLMWQAAQRGVGSNIGYFNRSDARLDAAARSRAIRAAVSRPLDPRTVYLFPEEWLWALMHELKGKDDVMLVCDGHRLLFPGGARLGLVDEPFSPPPPLAAGVWRAVGAGGDGNGYLTYGWSWEEPWGRWTDFGFAGLLIRQAPDEIGQERTLALRFTLASTSSRRPAQRYRIRVRDQVLAEGALGESGGAVQVTVPAALNPGRLLSLELELPDAKTMASDGRILGLGLSHLWLSARPGEQPPPLPAPAEQLPTPAQ